MPLRDASISKLVVRRRARVVSISRAQAQNFYLFCVLLLFSFHPDTDLVGNAYCNQ